jgi:hypothetical protein
MPNTSPFIEFKKPQESIVSQSNLILVEEIFQDISRKMLETNYTVGQLLKIAPKLKSHLWQKMKPNKP